ncbi:MAG TPA: AI-2E family transporter [Anaeromyxobacteraceae bacterium]|nr:AI-2E family transporter [Anaeromyxobacteraceae bacterium]
MPHARPTTPSRATFVAVLVASLALLAAVLLPLWKPLFLACVLAAALSAWQEALARRLGGRRSLAAALLTIAVVLLVVGPLATVAALLVREALSAAQSLQRTFEQGGVQGLVALLPDAVEGWARRGLDRLPSSWDGLARRAAEQGAAAATFLSRALSSTSSALFDAAMMLIALFFLLVDGRRLIAWLCGISPLGAGTTSRILGTLHRTGTSVVRSIVATAAVQGAVSTVGYLIARVPDPFLFGLLTFFAAFIPSVGTSVVALPLAAWLLLSGHLLAGAFLAAWALLVTGTIDNVLKPWLARGGDDVNGVVVFFAMIGGIFTFGALGLIVGPLAVSLFLALVRVGWAEVARRRGDREPEPPLPGAAPRLPGEPAPLDA